MGAVRPARAGRLVGYSFTGPGLSGYESCFWGGGRLLFQHLKLTDENIEDLRFELSVRVTSTTNRREIVSLPSHWRSKVKGFISYYHLLARTNGGLFEPLTCCDADFNNYLVSGEYDPTQPIHFWNRPKAQSQALTTLNRNIKLSRTDFPKLTSAVGYTNWKQLVVIAAKAQNILAAVEDDGTVVEADTLQRMKQWMFQTLHFIVIDGHGKSIVLKHLDDQDTWEIFKEMHEYYSNCMAGQLRLQQLIAFLTTTKIKNWTGTHESFLMHYEKQVRDHDTIAKPGERFTDQQKISFLHVVEALHGVTV